MGLYLDSAVAGEVEELARLPVLFGVTTNPTLVCAALGLAPGGSHVAAGDADELPWETPSERELDLYRSLLRRLGPDRPLFVQVPSVPAERMAAAARRRAVVGAARVIFKLPATWDGIRAATLLKEQGYRVALTAVYTPEQAYAGALAGVDFVIPYVGRIRAAGADFRQALEQMAGLIRKGGSPTRLLAASVKSPEDARWSLLSGADDVSVPFAVFQALIAHPSTEEALRAFDASWAALSSG
ncbi:MAG: transaldolase family protein [Bacillota bacterium]